MDKQLTELEEIFEKANQRFLERNPMLFEMKISERTLCGALMIELYEEIKKTKYSSYFVDVEYNRNVGGKLKTIRKTIKGADEQIITINCDLIVHSRGQIKTQDNLIALEMKKSIAREKDKDSDRIRLQCLTKDSSQDVWSYDGKTLPEHVCGYRLGIYYEINFRKNSILVEYYKNGDCYADYRLKIF
ncbi:hypothetical protein [uncultured Eubacterium sp.]|uniref:hypothetical protein n=1 Tax=uncultured Eubacterium sp. TaxID=165185 RepID=UPI003263B20C